jgi:hypothetical protein
MSEDGDDSDEFLSVIAGQTYFCITCATRRSNFARMAEIGPKYFGRRGTLISVNKRGFVFFVEVFSESDSR